MDKGSDQTKLIATYFGAAFGILQIVDIVIDRVDLPPEIINYLLIAIIIGFIGILFYLYIPSLKNAKIEKIKDKKSLFNIIGIVVIFGLSISNIFLFRKSNIGDIREEAYTIGFKKIDDYLDKEDFISAYNIANQYKIDLPDDPLVIDKLNLSSDEADINSSPEKGKVFYKRIDDEEWSYLGETPLKTRIPRGYINFKISKPGYVDYLSLTSVSVSYTHLTLPTICSV